MSDDVKEGNERRLVQSSNLSLVNWRRSIDLRFNGKSR